MKQQYDLTELLSYYKLTELLSYYKINSDYHIIKLTVIIIL